MLDLKGASWVAGLVSVLALPAAAPASLLELHPNLASGLQGTYAFPDTNDAVNPFNGNLHLTVPLGKSYAVSETFRYQLVLHYNSNVWKRTQVNATTVRAEPVRPSNSGIGWDLHFGRLWAPQTLNNPTSQWVYVASDGSLHAFHSTLHAGVTENDPGDIAQYTRNGTYLRLKQISTSERRVESPDGSWRRFIQSGPNWMLTDYRNSSGKGFTLAYLTDLWEIRDDHGRVQKIYFRDDTTGAYGKIVDRVELTAFGGAKALYDFEYTNETFSRGCTDNDPTTGNAPVPFLSSVRLADGTQYRFSFKAGSTNCHDIGRISTVELPTLGHIEYDYAWRGFYQVGCPSELPSALLYASGVSKRRTRDASSQLKGEWALNRAVSPAYGGTACSGPLNLMVDLWRPGGDLDRFWFNVTSSSQAWERGTYGYPFIYTHDWGGRKLSTQVYDCASMHVTCHLKRNLWVRYDHDADVEPLQPLLMAQNRREANRWLNYIDDTLPTGGLTYTETDRRRFDGLGNFREVETSDNWGSAPAEIRTTEYAAAVGDFPQIGWTMPAPSAPWVLSVFSSQTVATKDGSQKLVTEHCYQPANGLVVATRTWWAANVRSANDLLETHVYDAWGNRVRTSHYGGDVQALSTSSKCAAPSAAQYAVLRTFDRGVLARATYLDASGGVLSTHEVDRDIDSSTGLTAAERDSAGLETAYFYDTSGQLTSTRPEAGHGAWLFTSRFPPSGNSGGSVRVERAASGGGAPLAVEEFELDNFERKVRHTRAMPGGTSSDRRWEYDAMGRVAKFFDWGAANPTIYLARDAFGRELQVRPPDGAHHDLFYVYRGDRERDGRGKAWYRQLASSVEEREFRYTETRDRRNLVVRRVDHPMAGHLSQRVTEQQYDLRGNQISGKLDGVRTGAINTYDRRGLLTRVEGSNGAATTYGSFDALGLPTRENRGSGDIVNVYDRQARLVRAQDSAGTLWKEFVYADANAAGSLQAGKLVRQDRWVKDWEGWMRLVRETFAYGGVGGRLSSMTLAVSKYAGTFTTEMSYDDLGSVASVRYPRCTGCAAESRGTVMRQLTVENGMEDGQLVQVKTLDSTLGTSATSLSYHPSGLISEIRFPHGYVEQWTQDPSGLPRLSQAVIRPPQGMPTTYDTLQYDGTGRQVTARKTDWTTTLHFLIPEMRSDPTQSQPFSPGYDPCWNKPKYVDPFGLASAAGRAWNCLPDAGVYVNANDRPVLTERVTANTATWAGYGPRGELLTEYETQRVGSGAIWFSLTDYVYRDGRILKMIKRTPPGTTSKYHHVGYGAPGAETSGW